MNDLETAKELQELREWKSKALSLLDRAECLLDGDANAAMFNKDVRHFLNAERNAA